MLVAPPSSVSSNGRDPQVKPRRRWWPWLLVMGLVVVGLGSVPILSRRRLEQDLPRLTTPAERRDLTVRLRVSGRVQPVRQVNISPREAGRLAALFVEQGERVSAGQLLARMDFGDVSSPVAQAQARLRELQLRLQEQQRGELPEVIAAAQARVSAQASRLDLAERELARIAPLVAAGVLRRSEWDRAQASRDQAQADLEAAQADLRRLQAGPRPEQIQQTQAQIAQAQAQLQQAQSRLAETEIRAPFSGLVIQRYADVGAFVTPTTSASDATAATSSSILALADGLEIRAEVPESQIAGVSVGQTVQIRSVAFPDQIIPGVVRRIAPATVVVREVTVFYVTITPEDSHNLLRAGMNVSVDFVGDPIPQAVTVPAVAVIYAGNQQGVIVWDPQQRQPVYRLVETGLTQEGVTQIIRGLEPGERVFLTLPPGRTLQSFTGVDTGPDIRR
ncbi:MAG: efflux RND transporter periplasmic adaptor subunit [Thermostichales cyanobacterium GMQP_bins_62]